MRGCLSLLFLFYFSLRAASQSGTLDSAFGTDGFVVTKIPGSSETHFEQSALQANGKIVVVGWAVFPGSNTMNYDMIVVRYNSNGSRDAAFGENGIVITDFDRRSDFAYSVAIQPDGKIVVGGRTQELDGSLPTVALARYNTNGTLDRGFGKNGKIVTSLDEDSEIKKILIQKNGKIVVVGFTQDFLLIRYNADGSVDGSFGKNGIVETDFDGSYDIAVSAVIQNDKIVVAGNTGNDIGLARYNTNGSLDKSFGDAGKVKTDLGKDVPQLSDITIQDDNSIIAAGTVYKLSTAFQDFDFLLMRYTPTGALDNSFGQKGIVYTDFGHNTDETITSIAIQDQKIIVGGGVSPYKSSRTASFALARYHPNGILDMSFATASVPGITKTNFRLVSDNQYYNFISSLNIMKNTLYCVGINKLANDNGDVPSTQGIVAAYRLGNKNLACTPDKTVATDKGLCSAVVSDVGPVLRPSGNNSVVKFAMTGATIENGTGSVNDKIFNKGVTAVTYKLANDPAQSCSFLVTVQDREAPVLTNISASPVTLWPPNHKLQLVTINYRVKDNCSAKGTLSVRGKNVNEQDWEVVDSHHVRLKATRAGQTYMVTVTATDNAGNKSSQRVNVVVAHNK